MKGFVSYETDELRPLWLKRFGKVVNWSYIWKLKVNLAQKKYYVVCTKSVGEAAYRSQILDYMYTPCICTNKIS